LKKLVLLPDVPIPIDDNYYDGLTCIAALSQGHVRPELLAVSLKHVNYVKISKNYLFSKMYDSPHDTNAIVWYYSVVSPCSEVSIALGRTVVN